MISLVTMALLCLAYSWLSFSSSWSPPAAVPIYETLKIRPESVDMDRRVAVLNNVEDELGVVVEPEPVRVEGDVDGEGKDYDPLVKSGMWKSSPNS